uniref:GDSL esterase/lipase n=1 Tax=Aegilops tauschii subsp. strangulata TaxID=200361 RepID=A0A453S2J5_AEGTS
FVFGDSLLDSGNNNNLASLAKANYLPYGIDFAAGPTGRFCNGYTIVDELAELLGLPLVPAYSQVSGSGQQLLQGVNYASAAAGILDDSGGNFVARIPFNQQIQNFESTVGQIAVSAGGTSAAASIVSRSIVFVGLGSNDYLNNYIMANYETRRHYTPQQFADLLVTQYTSQLTVGCTRRGRGGSWWPGWGRWGASRPSWRGARRGGARRRWTSWWRRSTPG